MALYSLPRRSPPAAGSEKSLLIFSPLSCLFLTFPEAPGMIGSPFVLASRHTAAIMVAPSSANTPALAHRFAYRRTQPVVRRVPPKSSNPRCLELLVGRIASKVVRKGAEA